MTNDIVRAKVPTITIEEFEELYGKDIPHDGFTLYGHSIPNGLVGDVVSIDNRGVDFEWWLPIKDEDKQHEIGVKTYDGQLIFEGDTVQPVRVSHTNIKGMETIVNETGTPFIVKPNNYVYGKFVAENVRSNTFAIENYWLSHQLKIIKRPYN